MAFLGPGPGHRRSRPARRAGIAPAMLYIFLKISLSNILNNFSNIKLPAVSAVGQEEPGISGPLLPDRPPGSGRRAALHALSWRSGPLSLHLHLHVDEMPVQGHDVAPGLVEFDRLRPFAPVYRVVALVGNEPEGLRVTDGDDEPGVRAWFGMLRCHVEGDGAIRESGTVGTPQGFYLQKWFVGLDRRPSAPKRVPVNRANDDLFPIPLTPSPAVLPGPSG